MSIQILKSSKPDVDLIKIKTYINYMYIWHLSSSNFCHCQLPKDDLHNYQLVGQFVMTIDIEIGFECDFVLHLDQCTKV